MPWEFFLCVLVHSGQKVTYTGWCRQQELIFWCLSRLRSPRSGRVLAALTPGQGHCSAYSSYSASLHDRWKRRESRGVVRNVNGCDSCLSLVKVIHEDMTLKALWTSSQNAMLSCVWLLHMNSEGIQTVSYLSHKSLGTEKQHGHMSPAPNRTFGNLCILQTRELFLPDKLAASTCELNKIHLVEIYRSLSVIHFVSKSLWSSTSFPQFY